MNPIYMPNQIMKKVLEDAKGIIQELEMLGIKPAAIMRSLRDKTSILPTILQSERLFGYV